MGRSAFIWRLCLFLLFSLAVSVKAVRSPRSVPLSTLYNLSPGTSPRFPQGQAERLIRSLGLLPGAAEESSGLVYGPGLHERKIQLDISANSTSASGSRHAGHYAGFFTLKRSHAANMFYTFFESRGNKGTDPLVLLMTGGPACASEVAMFYENGPFKIQDNIENLTLIWNKFGWDQEASIIYVDLPVGTGFSYSTNSGDIRHDAEGVSEDMLDFFQVFFAAHPEFAENDLYVMGESYGSHYVPAVAARLHEEKKLKQGLSINLKGFAIGSGLAHPNIRYESYADYALNMGLIADDDHKRLSKVFPACATAIKLCGTKGTVTCIAAYLICQSIFNTILAISGNINSFDIRKECNEDICYDFSNLEIYLNYTKVREALGVGNQKFLSCSPLVYEAILMDWMKSKENKIASLLDDGIQILVYAGEFDLICNWLGNLRWTAGLPWSGQIEYAKAPWKKLEVDGIEAGLATGFKNLNFVKIQGAGHMVAMDQPKIALEMFRRWTRGIPLGNGITRKIPTSKQLNPESVFQN